MSKTLKHILLAASIAVTSAVFTTTASAGGTEDAIAAAKDARKQAKSVGGEWRDTGKMINKAEKLLKEGKSKEATKLAQEAEAQGMLGYMQATSQTSENLHI